MKKLNRYPYQFIALVLLMLVGILFQNCSRARFLSRSEKSVTTKNNAGAYGGKVSGTFYRFIPDFKCENRESFVASLEVQSSAVLLTENKRLLCGAVLRSFLPELIDSSIYQNEIVGYEEGIFEGNDTVPTAIPADLVEVWCKDRGDLLGIETVTHFDRTLQSAANKVYYSNQVLGQADSGPQSIASLSVSRVLTENRVLIRDGNQFQLTVFRDQPDTQQGLFKGQMEVEIQGQRFVRETSCRLGGLLDPKVWPARQIVDFNVSAFKTSPDLSRFAYSSASATGIPNLYTSDISGFNQLQAAPNMLQKGIDVGLNGNFHFTADSKHLIYSGDVNLPSVLELFKVAVDGTGATQLNDRLTHSSQATEADFKLTDDGLSVVYRDGSQSAPGQTYGMWLKSVPLTGGTPLTLNGPFNQSYLGVKQFAVSASQRKVAYLCCEIYADLYSVNFDGTARQRITPAFPSADWHFRWNEPVLIPNGGSQAFIRAHHTNAISGVYSYLYAVSLDGSGSIQFPADMTLDQISGSGTTVLLKSITPNSSVAFESKLMNILTGTQFSISPTIEPFFAQDSRTLIGQHRLGDGTLKAIAISTENGNSAELCPAAGGDDIQISEISQNDFLIVSIVKLTGIVNVFVKPNGLACRKVNSMPLTKTNLDSIQSVTLSSDNSTALITLAQTVLQSIPLPPRQTQQVLYYVPLNGRPALIVNSPAFAGANIGYSLMLKESKTVLFWGDQIRPGDYNIFNWTAPP